jgi:glycyl-tRNA synthetase beta chain
MRQEDPTLAGQLLKDANDFSRERVRFILEHRGYRADLARAATHWELVVPLLSRRIAEALRPMLASDDFQALAGLFKRVKNIAKELEKQAELDRDALTEPAERALIQELDKRRARVNELAARHDYKGAFLEIAGLRGPVDRFFTEVFVMAEDLRLRTARLTLMAELRDLILRLADISEIVPQTE